MPRARRDDRLSVLQRKYSAASVKAAVHTVSVCLRHGEIHPARDKSLETARQRRKIARQSIPHIHPNRHHQPHRLRANSIRMCEPSRWAK